MLEVLLILLLVSASCSLIGSVLVLKDQAMIADALSHSVLLGIVLGFFISHSLDSPLLMVGAALFGVVTVWFIDFLHTSKVEHDAATGIVYSFLFSVAVILISVFARNVHLDIDMVLMGEVLFAPLHRLDLFGLSLPVSLVKSAVMLVINLTFFSLVYQPLKLYLFDETQARLSGGRVRFLSFATLLLVSMTTVFSFDAIGSMTVIVFLVAPSMGALLWSRSFWQFLLIAQIIGAMNVLIGYTLALHFDLTMSGTCAVMSLFSYCIQLVIKKAGKKRSNK
ncbi:metal ABC transporter permease [Streptococcus minor]|uniref:metal ABC transporter permease n=1 Tax=Streptococcus minor TaxID=229549 RepID=UPI0003774DEC|nr:metal ABC transporter permease [Streptococcus minor]